MSVVGYEGPVGGVQKSSQPKFGNSKVKQELAGNRPPPLMISRESHKIRKASLPLPAVQYRRPVIIHTYSPKIITTEPSNFMWLVQLLTGSSDTRSRCKKSKPTKSAVSLPPAPKEAVSTAVTNTTDIGDIPEQTQATLDRRNSLSSSFDGEALVLESSCESEEFLLTDMAAVVSEAVSDYRSPRGPLPPSDTVFALSGGANLPRLLYPSVNALSQGLIQVTEPAHQEITLLPTAQALAPSLSSPSILPPGFFNDFPFLSPGMPRRVDSAVSPKFSPFKSSFTSQNQFSPFAFYHAEDWDNSFLEFLSSPASDNIVNRDIYQISIREA